MSLVPVVRCRSIERSLAFYTRVLDFQLDSRWPAQGDPAYAVLRRNHAELHLSSHAGDGAFGQAVVVPVTDLARAFATFVANGLDVAGKPQSPVHCAPVAQTWGTTEFYADDPDGNTMRLVQVHREQDGSSR
ncbi:MAG: VOC family protein [Planctomycetes bacterium]|nr:VOC family protein [Planctomycetota bacterium]